MDDKTPRTFGADLAQLSQEVATAWQVQLALAARTPHLARPLLARSLRSYRHFAQGCDWLAQYVQVDARGRLRTVGRKVLAGAMTGAALTMAVSAPGVRAAGIHVDSGVDGGGCDLIDAITSANTDTAVGDCTAGNGADVIFLNGTNQYFSAANNTDLDGPTATPLISSTITIEGSGAVLSRTVGITESFRILAIANDGNLTLNNSVVSGGALGRSGGGIRNDGALTVKQSIISGNRANNGGGGIANNGTLAVNDSTLSGNTGGYNAGGIANNGTLAVNGSTISGNLTSIHGGGVHNNGTATIENSTIFSNTASEDGGGIFNLETLAVNNSTLSGNTADQNGGGIYNFRDRELSVAHSTLSGNRAGDNGGGIFNGGLLALRNSTLSGNKADSLGGGIYSQQELILDNSILSGNTASSGGGVYNNATASVTHSTFFDNKGGGLYNTGGTASVTRSTFVSNTASTGGGLYNSLGTMAVTHSSVVSNTALDGGGIINKSATSRMSVSSSTVSGNEAVNGGGIYNDGVMTIKDSTLSGNTVGKSGGGLYNNRTLTITHSTVFSNTSGNEGGGIYSNDIAHIGNSTISGNTAGGRGGGGFYNSGDFTIANSTITANSTSGNGGGIYNRSPAEKVGSTIVAGNTATTTASADVFGLFDTLGFNLIGVDDNSEFTATTDLTGTVASPLNPQLDALRDNGGPTHTHALQPGSPAIDAGSCKVGATIDDDQRRRPRPLDVLTIDNADDGCDIGAYENQLINLVKSVDLTKAGVGDTLHYTLSVRNTSIEATFISSLTDTLLPGPFNFVDKDDNPFDLENDFLVSGAAITATVSRVVTDSDFLSAAFIDGRLVNTATVSAQGDGPPTSDVDDAAVLLLRPSLRLFKSVSSLSVVAGETLTYTIHYTNGGPGAAANVFITDTLPLSVTFGSFVAAEPALPIFVHDPGPPATLSWYTPTLAAMPPPATGVITYTVIVDPFASGPITNSAVITSSTPFTPLASLSDRATVEVKTAPKLAISAQKADQNEGDSGVTAFTFTVTRADVTSGTTTVDYAVTGFGSDPVDGSDFVGGVLPGGTLTFTTGESNVTLTVDVQGDTDVEGDEDFEVLLSNASPNGVITNATAKGVIRNDDRSLSIAAENTDRNEGDSGNTAFTFTVTRNGDTSGSVDVSYAVTGSGAEPAGGADFAGGALPSDTLTLGDGESSQTLTINVQGDQEVELDEGFTVTLSNPSANATISVAAAEGVIRNDDVAALVVGKTANASSAEPGDTVIYTYRITNTGTVELTISDVVDNRLGDVSLDTTSLAPDDVASGTASHTVQQSDLPGPLTNTVVVTAAGGGVTVTGSASVSVLVSETPTITGTLSGTVGDQSGNAIENAQVQITNESSGLSAALVRTKSTNAEGVYLFADVPVGTYTLTVTADGYRPSQPLSVLVTEGDTTSVNTVVLVEEESGDTALFLPAVANNSAGAGAAAANLAGVDDRRLFLPALVR